MTECRNLTEHFSLKVATFSVPTELPLWATLFELLFGEGP